MKTKLDFSDYPDIVNGDIFWRPPSERLKAIPYLYERSASCLNFLFRISDYTSREGYPPEMHAAAQIRAALVEFVGIEEAVQSAGYEFKIMSLPSPLLHFMRLLRNYQIHIGSHSISKKSIDVIFAGQETSIEVSVIDNLHPDKFMQLAAIAKYGSYNPSDIQVMIELFNTQQTRLGVYEILRIGAQRLITEAEKVF